MRFSPAVWGASVDELGDRYRSDQLMPAAPGRWLRAVDVAAPADAVFRRVCQLRAAPYSYDWVDNFGRRSPSQLLPWCWDLQVGDRVMTIFTLQSFEPGRELTVTMNRGWPAGLFGDLALTYRVTPVTAGTSRLVAVARVADAGGPVGGLRRRLLACGDLVMMRKQLLTLARLAEADAARATAPTDERRASAS